MARDEACSIAKDYLCSYGFPHKLVRFGIKLFPMPRQAGKELDLPVYFGDAGSPGVLHSVGAHRAKCAVITLDTPGANYRTVWALNKVRRANAH